MGPLKLSPASGLTFQPAVFYWAYLQRGLAGSWENLGSPTEPLTHSGAPTIQLGLNYSHLCCVPGRFAPESRCHMNRFELGRHKNVTCSPLFYIWQLKTPFQSWSISGASLWRECFQVCNRQSFSTNEAVIYMLGVCWTIRCNGYLGQFQRVTGAYPITQQSLSPPPPTLSPPSSFLFYLHLSHVPSIPLSSSSSSALFPLLFCRIKSVFCYRSPFKSLTFFFFISVSECWSPPRSRSLTARTHTDTHACAFN